MEFPLLRLIRLESRTTRRRCAGGDMKSRLIAVVIHKRVIYGRCNSASLSPVICGRDPSRRTVYCGTHRAFWNIAVANFLRVTRPTRSDRQYRLSNRRLRPRNHPIFISRPFRTVTDDFRLKYGRCLRTMSASRHKRPVEILLEAITLSPGLDRRKLNGFVAHRRVKVLGAFFEA